jgi:hypothetical protein
MYLFPGIMSNAVEEPKSWAHGSLVVEGGERKNETRQRERDGKNNDGKHADGNQSKKKESNLITPYSKKRLVERSSSDKLLLIGSNG